jgi:hypothetical protein
MKALFLFWARPRLRHCEERGYLSKLGQVVRGNPQWNEVEQRFQMRQLMQSIIHKIRI